MKKLSEFLFDPEQNVFKGVMSIDTYGLAFLIETFSSAYNKSVNEEEDLVGLDETWVQDLSKKISFSVKDKTGFYQLSMNTKKISFVHGDNQPLIATSSVPDWFIAEHGEENVQVAENIPIASLLRFLINYNFYRFFDREEIEFDEIHSFCIRDYENQEEIIIPMSDIIEK